MGIHEFLRISMHGLAIDSRSRDWFNIISLACVICSDGLSSYYSGRYDHPGFRPNLKHLKRSITIAKGVTIIIFQRYLV